MKSLFKNSLFLLSLIGLITIYSCGEDEDPEPDGTSAIDISNDATLGNVLVDGNGVTLYFFSNDANGSSACLEGCLDKWPLFYAESPLLGEGLDAADFASITHSNGEMQSTYKGWPLYYYAPADDGVVEAPGETAGEGIGGVWYVAKPDYKIMIVSHQLTGHDGKSYLSDYSEGTGKTSYFVDAYGNTLYGFVRDYNGINNFTAADFSNNAVWPIYETATGSIPSGLNSSDFGTIDVHGRTQVTYKGWPLYTFGQDAGRGDNKGVSFPAPGVWPIINTATPTAATKPTVKLMDHETFGEVLTDGEGQVLYFFTKDVAGTSACSGGCLNFWSTFYTGKIIVPNDGELDASDFDNIMTTGGMQTTYKGWPLYYYSPTGDGEVEAAGEIGGDGVNNVWYVAKEGYDLMIADAQLVGHDGNNYLSDYTIGTGATKFFTDQEGRTLYIFVNDALNTNNFTKEDFSNDGVWPIFHTDIDDLPSGINAADFGEIEVFGKKQLTFKGWPVYYFGQDEGRGQTKGVSFPQPGIWPIINNDTQAAQ